jgi:putative ABC transport system permease protein
MKNPTPPKWADRFLEWYCRADRLEEIQGDVHELFDRVANQHPRRARWLFIWNVLRFFRLTNLRRGRSLHQANFITMFSNYLLIGFRSAVRNGLTSVINIGGLALGVAGAITIFIFADQWFHVDDFHANRHRIYEVANTVIRDGKPVTMSDTPLLLGPMLAEDASMIEKFTRIEVGNGALRFADNVFFERLWFTDPTFFEIFTFSHVGVPPDALASKNSIVITRPIEEKYFGSRSALGQTVSIKFPNNAIRDFTVTAVADLPANNTLHFNVVLSMDVFLDLRLKDAYDWNYQTDATFVLLKDGQSAESLLPLMDKYKKLQNDSRPDWPIEQFVIYDLPSLAADSGRIESNMIGSGEPQGIYAMSIIAFLLLLLACFNYTNISVATISTRLKEIGIRKVIGGRKSEIVQQFLAENFLMCTFAVVAGLIIAFTVFMPGITAMVGYPIPFSFSSGRMMLYFFAGLFTFLVMVSGVYPAVYVSGFQPVQILKGKEKFGQRSAFSRVLLTLQFVLAFMTIVGCFVFIDNTLYLWRKDWGYDHHQNIVVPVNNVEQYLKLRDRLTSRKDIAQWAGAAHHIGSDNQRTVLDFDGRKTEMVRFGVGYDYLETMNIRLKEGRFFDRSMPSDSVASLVVNESFVRSMGWTNGVNQFFSHEGKTWTVIGVVEDFHYADFYMGISPVMIYLAAEQEFKYLSLKVAGNQVAEVESEIRSWWKEIGPDDPYRGILQNDVFYNFNRNTRNDLQIISWVAVVTLILACLGLYGLVSYNITRRLKEFSVRKVFGARTLHLFQLMNRDYAWILIIAFLVGAPAGFYLMNMLIEAIYYGTRGTGVMPFLIAVVMMVLTVAVTVGAQMSRVIRENPAQTLRSE